MRNLLLFTMLLAAAVAFGWGGVPSAAWAQEQLDMGDVDISFDVEGPEFDPEAQRAAAEAAGAAAGIILVVFLVAFVIWLALSVVALIGGWKVFVKAGQPGWAVIIPIYNAIVLLQICGRPVWWIVLLLIPFVQVVVGVIVAIDLAKSFGKDALFGIGLFLLGFIFFPILGFGSAQYRGPVAAP